MSYQKVSTQPPHTQQQHAAVCSSDMSFSACLRVRVPRVWFVVLLTANYSGQLCTKKLSPEEAEERRRKAAEAAEQRAQRFQQVTASAARAVVVEVEAERVGSRGSGAFGVGCARFREAAERI